MVKDRLTLKGMQLETDLDILKNCSIDLDKEKLKIAMCNIFVNAIEAMEEQKGHLKISSYNIEESIVMEVKDNGHGISEDHLSKMFNPFFTNKKSGVGLGLTTTKNIIEAHNGYIEIDSKLEEGTVFRIILPC